jgi:hypothetical protein
MYNSEGPLITTLIVISVGNTQWTQITWAILEHLLSIFNGPYMYIYMITWLLRQWKSNFNTKRLH